MIHRLLLAAAGGAGSFTSPPAPMLVFPDDYTTTRFAGNPIIEVNVTETLEQYEPAPFQATNGDVWVYVKGNSRIYAYKSTDGGETFSIQNGGSPVLTPGGAWDNTFVVEPTVVYDEANGIIHLWYKGRDNGSPNNWQWGHATAPDSDPTDFTKDAANPIYSFNDMSTDLGGGSIEDLGISSVLLIGSTVHFYGYCSHNGTYKLVQATGTTWNDPSGGEAILAPGGGDTVFRPSVFKAGDDYVMIYTHGDGNVGTTTSGSLKVGTSSDGETWSFPGTVLLAPTGTGWEEYWAYGAQMLRISETPWDLPLLDGSGRWRLYYSGESDGPFSQTGLAYIEPT